MPGHTDDVAYQIALLIDGAFTSRRLSRVGATRILQSAARALIGDDGFVARAPAAIRPHSSARCGPTGLRSSSGIELDPQAY